LDKCGAKLLIIFYKKELRAKKMNLGLHFLTLNPELAILSEWISGY
jgi:hypothetical protein